MKTIHFRRPDEPMGEPDVAPPPVEPVETPTEPEPPAAWEFPTFDPPTPPTDPAPSDDDSWKHEIVADASRMAFQAQTQVQQNYQVMRQTLAKQNASDDVIAVAEREFWGLGQGALNKANISAVIKYSVGEVVTQGGSPTRSRPSVTAPDAAPVGDLTPRNPRTQGVQAEVDTAMAAFNAEIARAGIKGLQLTEDDFTGVQ